MTGSDAPQGMLPPPETDALPTAVPHPVPRYTFPRWQAALSAWWRGAFPKPNRRRFFPRPVERAGSDAAADPAAPGVPVREA